MLTAGGVDLVNGELDPLARPERDGIVPRRGCREHDRAVARCARGAGYEGGRDERSHHQGTTPGAIQLRRGPRKERVPNLEGLL